MKFELPGAADYLANRAEVFGGERASLMLTDSAGNPRALIAAEKALLDCAYLGEIGPQLTVKVIPWEGVPVPWTAYAWFGSLERTTLTFRLALEDLAEQSYNDAEEQKGVREFWQVVLDFRRRHT